MVGKALKTSELKKEVREAVEVLVARGWKVRKEGHKARLYCPCASGCTTIPVPGSPANAGNAAKRILAAAGRCPLPEDSPRRSLTRRRES